MKNTREINHIKRKMERLERVMDVCSGQPEGDELPQTANHKETIISLLHKRTGQPVEDLDAICSPAKQNTSSLNWF